MSFTNIFVWDKEYLNPEFYEKIIQPLGRKTQNNVWSGPRYLQVIFNVNNCLNFIRSLLNEKLKIWFAPKGLNCFLWNSGSKESLSQTKIFVKTKHLIIFPSKLWLYLWSPLSGRCWRYTFVRSCWRFVIPPNRQTFQFPEHETLNFGDWKIA